MAGLSIPKTIADAYRAVPKAASPAAPALAAYAIVSAAFAVVPPRAGSMAAEIGAWLALALATIAMGVLLSALIYRAAAPGLFTDAIAAAWRRLFGANLLIYLLFGVLGFFFVFFLSIASGVLIASTGYDPEAAADGPSDIAGSLAALNASGAVWALYLFLAAGVAGFAWLALRLFLYGAASAAPGGVAVFSTWAWTKGQVARLFLVALAALFGPYLVYLAIVSGLAFALGFPTVFDALGGGAELPADPGIAAIWAAVQTALGYPLILLGHGMAASAYRQLAPHQQAAADAFD